MKAFSLAIILILSAQFATAQNKGEAVLPVPVIDSTICYEGVMNANPALSRDQLYQKVRQWAATKIIVPPHIATILYENPAEGNISARLMFNTINLSASVNTNYMITEAVIHFQVKQGKIKYTITDFLYTHGEITSSYKNITQGGGLALFLNATSEQTSRAHRAEFVYYLSEINRVVQIHLKSLQAYIKKPAQDEF